MLLAVLYKLQIRNDTAFRNAGVKVGAIKKVLVFSEQGHKREGVGVKN